MSTSASYNAKQQRCFPFVMRMFTGYSFITNVLSHCMSRDTEVFILEPDWRYNFVPYTIAILLLPLAGLGILIFAYYARRITGLQYHISNDDITVYKTDGNTRFPIKHIQNIELTQTRAERWFELGTLHLTTNSGTLDIIGISSPHQIKEALEIAIAKEVKWTELDQKARGEYTDIKIGGLQSMDELVGLWQQGLISEDEYNRERKKFEQ